MLLVTKLDNSVFTETVTRGMAALLQSSVGVEFIDAERELFSIDYIHSELTFNLMKQSNYLHKKLFKISVFLLT